MARSSTLKDKPKAGRPTRYKTEYDEQAFNYCLLGATDVQLAEFFGVTEKTIANWKNAHPTFIQSLKEGKAAADSKVANSLYQRALGYSHPDVHISNYQGEITITPIIKHYAPDTTACIFWLKNRDKVNWRDRHEVTGEDGGALAFRVLLPGEVEQSDTNG